MNLTPTQLSAAVGIPVARAQEWAIFIDNATDQFDIVTPRRIAAFVAQCAHESAFFTRLKENMNYSTPERIVEIYGARFRVPERVDKKAYRIQLAKAYVKQPVALANFVYANRGGNGPVESGDGFRYRARGLIGITFKDNYQWIGDGLGIDLVAHPERLEEPGLAALSAAYYWSSSNLNDYADAWEIDAISGVINCGDPQKIANGAAERRALSDEALQAFSV